MVGEWKRDIIERIVFVFVCVKTLVAVTSDFHSRCEPPFYAWIQTASMLNLGIEPWLLTVSANHYTNRAYTHDRSSGCPGVLKEHQKWRRELMLYQVGSKERSKIQIRHIRERKSVWREKVNGKDMKRAHLHVFVWQGKNNQVMQKL